MSQKISLAIKKKPLSPVSESLPEPKKTLDIRPNTDQECVVLEIPRTIRQKACNILHRKLNSYFTEEELQSLEGAIHNRAQDIGNEKGITECHDREFADHYNTVLRNCVLNLDPKSYLKNTFLLAAVKDSSIQLVKVPFMTPQEMLPQVWSKQIRYMEAESQIVSVGEAVSTSDLIKCGKCGSETIFTERQTRSCDEAMTIHVKCPKCGNSFSI